MMKKLVPMLALLLLLQMMITLPSYASPPGGGAPGGGAPGDGGCGGYHTVQYGETLYSIGRKYGVDPHQIIEANSLYNPDYIYVGQSLVVPCARGDQPKPGDGYDKPNKDQAYQKPYDYQYPAVGYGYDYTGYYYETYYPKYSRYSYTCGYHYNCY